MQLYLLKDGLEKQTNMFAFQEQIFRGFIKTYVSANDVWIPDQCVDAFVK